MRRNHSIPKLVVGCGMGCVTLFFLLRFFLVLLMCDSFFLSIFLIASAASQFFICYFGWICQLAAVTSRPKVPFFFPTCVSRKSSNIQTWYSWRKFRRKSGFGRLAAAASEKKNNPMYSWSLVVTLWRAAGLYLKPRRSRKAECNRSNQVTKYGRGDQISRKIHFISLSTFTFLRFDWGLGLVCGPDPRKCTTWER